MMKKILFAISSAVIISACGGGGDTATAEKPLKDTFPLYCTYLYDASSTTIGFGAFKFTEKKEVKGGFLKFSVDSTSTSNNIIDIYEIFHNAKFSISVDGLDTKDQGRDYNIKTSFFGQMKETASITGKVIDLVDGKDSGSDLIVSLKFNNVENQVALKVSLVDNVLTLNGAINLNDFKAQKALSSLNKTCKDLHKGSDGKSVTWPEVNIYVSTTLKKNFPKK
jgi:polyisoprenoid-binding protein YceI